MHHLLAALSVLLVGGLVWSAASHDAAPIPGNAPVAAEAGTTAAQPEAPAEEPSGAAASTASPSPSSGSRPSPGALAPPSPGATPAAPRSASRAPAEVPTTGSTATDVWTVINVVDGDTVDVRSASGNRARVRVIGIDTPERGECGFSEASSALTALVLHQQVDLVAGARDDRDRYGRILRYVDVGSTDPGLSLIQQGYAIARYDSRDGYGHHRRQDAYIAADTATTHYCAGTAKPSPSPEAAPPPRTSPTEQRSSGSSNPWGTSSCHPAYDPCVPPTSEVGDLDCPDVRTHYPAGVKIDHARGDPHRLDGDKDGHGCE